MNWKNAYNYMVQVIAEETAFRILFIHFAGYNWWGIITSSVMYALMHRILFKWQMVVACLPLGLVLGFLYVSIPFPFSIITVVIVHFIIGALAWHFGITKKWEKDKDRRFYA